MSKDKGRQTEDTLFRQATGSTATADAAITAAGTTDPLRQRLIDRVTKILDWREGKGGPMDVRNFTDQAAMSLYSDSKRVSDEGRVGRGYGTLADGGSDTHAAALGKELESGRALEASGRLEDFINASLMGADAEAGNLGSAEEAKRMALAQLRNSNANSNMDRWVSYLMRPKQPSFLRQLAVGAASGLAGNPGLAKMI